MQKILLYTYIYIHVEKKKKKKNNSAAADPQPVDFSNERSNFDTLAAVSAFSNERSKPQPRDKCVRAHETPHPSHAETMTKRAKGIYLRFERMKRRRW